MTKEKPQISFPAGLITHMEEWVDGVPGVNLPQEAAVQRTLKTLYPADMVRRGHVYIRAEAARALKVGDPIQIDRTHTTVSGVGKPEWVTDAGTSPSERVLACRVRLAEERTYV